MRAAEESIMRWKWHELDEVRMQPMNAALGNLIVALIIIASNTVEESYAYLWN